MRSLVPVSGILASELEGLKYKKDDTGVLMFCGQKNGNLELSKFISVFRAKDDLERQTGLVCVHIMCNIVPPGVSTPVHVDPWQDSVRFHYPVETNEKAQVLIGDAWTHFPVGYFIYLDHTKPHAVRNYGETNRIHLIFDMRVRK